MLCAGIVSSPKTVRPSGIKKFDFSNEERNAIINHLGTKEIVGDRVILRRFENDDLIQIYNNCCQYHEVWKWINYAGMKTSEDVKDKADMFTSGWINVYDRPNIYS